MSGDAHDGSFDVGSHLPMVNGIGVVTRGGIEVEASNLRHSKSQRPAS